MFPDFGGHYVAPSRLAPVLTLAFTALLLWFPTSARAQGLQVIYNFGGYASSLDGLIMDNTGTLYGTHGGVVYTLTQQDSQ